MISLERLILPLREEGFYRHTVTAAAFSKTGKNNNNTCATKIIPTKRTSNISASLSTNSNVNITATTTNTTRNNTDAAATTTMLMLLLLPV